MSKIKKGLSLILAMIMFCSVLIMPISALPYWNGVSSSSGATGDPTKVKNFRIHQDWVDTDTTKNSNKILGLRFSVYNIYSKQSSACVDIYREVYSSMASGRHKTTVKYNKIQIKNSYNSLNIDTAISSKDYLIDAKLGITLPTDTSKIGTWQNTGDNLSKVLKAIGKADGINSLVAGDKVLVEPIFPITVDVITGYDEKGKEIHGERKMNLTVSEIALYGAARFGLDKGTDREYVANTWNAIAGYTNVKFPNSLRLSSDLVDGSGKVVLPRTKEIRDKGKSVDPATQVPIQTFQELLDGGWGVGIAYSNDAAPTYYLTIKYDANGGTVGNGFKLDGTLIYNSNNTVKADVWEYDKTVNSGVTNGSTFGISREGYNFAGWTTEKNGGTYVNEDSPTKPSDLKASNGSNQEITLYAKWEQYYLTIKYVANALGCDLTVVPVRE